MSDTIAPTDLTAEEFAKTLTGWDEAAIEKAFGRAPDELGGLKAARAMIFTLARRQGMKDPAAYSAAMGLPGGEAERLFADEAPELDPEHPVTDQGKGDAPAT